MTVLLPTLIEHEPLICMVAQFMEKEEKGGTEIPPISVREDAVASTRGLLVFLELGHYAISCGDFEEVEWIGGSAVDIVVGGAVAHDGVSAVGIVGAVDDVVAGAGFRCPGQVHVAIGCGGGNHVLRNAKDAEGVGDDGF